MAYTKVNYGDTLRLGVQGDPVCDVQRFCNYGAAYGMDGLTVDGKFGPATEQSVKYFQHYAGLTIDGIVGPVTWRTMIENGALGIPGLKREGLGEVEAALARYNGTGDAAQAYGARNVELFSIFDAYNSRTRA